MASEAAAIVRVVPVPGGVELRAVAEDGQQVVLRLAAEQALTLADEVTLACEGRALVAAA